MFEEFQYGHSGGHLGYQIRKILAILNLYVTVIPPIKFRLNRTYGFGGDGGHLGYWNKLILAILNLHVATMPPIKFHLNPTYDSGEDVENV